MVELLDLPRDSLLEILSRSTIKTIGACRCVCKTLRELISSDPNFITLHSQNATQHDLIIQFGCDSIQLKDHVQLIDAEIDTKPPAASSKLRPRSIFKIPTLPIEEQCSRYYPNRARNRELNKFALVNACNGLIFFAVKYFGRCSLVCNPITNEYIRVPDSDRLRGCTSSLWLGYSPNSSRKYKVLRIYNNPFDHGIGAHIHDVGSSSSTSWREVASKLSDHIYWVNSYTFSLNGIKTYWVCRDSIVTFDFESEIFGKIDTPLTLNFGLGLMSIGVIKDRLYLIGEHANILDIWMLKESGEWEGKYRCYDPVQKPYYLCPTKLRPLQELSTGEILMVSDDRRLVCYDMKKNRFRSINLHMMKPMFNIVTFVPSFVSLKDMISLNE